SRLERRPVRRVSVNGNPFIQAGVWSRITEIPTTRLQSPDTSVGGFVVSLHRLLPQNTRRKRLSHFPIGTILPPGASENPVLPSPGLGRILKQHLHMVRH